MTGRAWKPGESVHYLKDDFINADYDLRVLIMPQVFPVTKTNMNYTGPIVGGVCGLSWIWYKLYWVRFYHSQIFHGYTPCFLL